MAKILLIETATGVCSTAIAVDGVIVAMREEPHAASHAALLTRQIEDCSMAAGIPLTALDAVALSAGPGSYTSLRVGASVAKGLCYALGKPLITVDTLLTLAAASLREIRLPGAVPELPDPELPVFLFPMLDARRQEVWTAAYDSGLRCLAPARPLILENNLFDEFVQVATGGTPGNPVFSGNGSVKFRNVLNPERAVFSPVVACSAAYLARFAETAFLQQKWQDLAYFEPIYMKPPNITTPGKPLF